MSTRPSVPIYPDPKGICYATQSITLKRSNTEGLGRVARSLATVSRATGRDGLWLALSILLYRGVPSHVEHASKWETRQGGQVRPQGGQMPWDLCFTGGGETLVKVQVPRD